MPDGDAVDSFAELDPEDGKLVTLARAARARNGAPEGAAVRDATGRTYVATTVALHALPLSALRAAVVVALASGADGLEAVAVVGESGAISADDVAILAELGNPSLLLAGPDGRLYSPPPPPLNPR